jgi:hypothetical protein
MVKMYVLTNGTYYYSKTETNKIVKVADFNDSFKFKSKEQASGELKRATKKLNGFIIQDLGGTDEQGQKICKRIRFDTDKRKEVYRKSKGHCCLCGKFVDYEEFTVDHIIPLAKGGTNEIDNLQCACKVCNNIKTDVLPNEFMDKITEMIIHNMNNKYNKNIGHKMIKMLFTSNIHRIIK